MTRRLFPAMMCAVLPWLLGACGVGGAAKAPGELGREFTATVPGIWRGEISDPGKSAEMIKQYNADGSASGVLMVKLKKPGTSLVMPEVLFTSRWRVKGDVVETYAVKTGFPGLFKPGAVIRDKVVSVSPDRIVYRSEETGDIGVLTRLRSSR